MADTTRPETLNDTDEKVADVVEGARAGIDLARERFQRVSENLQDRYRQVSDDVRRGAERASDELRRGAERARETYEETAHNVRRGYQRARTEAVRVTDEVSTYVRENPGKSVAIAAGVGFVLGLLLRGRRDDDI